MSSGFLLLQPSPPPPHTQGCAEDLVVMSEQRFVGVQMWLCGCVREMNKLKLSKGSWWHFLHSQADWYAECINTILCEYRIQNIGISIDDKGLFLDANISLLINFFSRMIEFNLHQNQITQCARFKSIGFACSSLLMNTRAALLRPKWKSYHNLNQIKPSQFFALSNSLKTAARNENGIKIKIRFRLKRR